MLIFSCSHIGADRLGKPITNARVTLVDELPESDRDRVLARKEWIEADVRLCGLCTAVLRTMLDQMAKEIV